ncbi:M48 family metalloprotease [Streptomyces sp. SAJ15]|uniref:M48 family metalloprotease n=1 Tax=Streptomyces sp. SAJ15 TaxID=2011095 RepID=UPI001642B5D7|nr:M48 family metalloprotease [Streptomyces sp. SAJ15]
MVAVSLIILWVIAAALSVPLHLSWIPSAVWILLGLLFVQRRAERAFVKYVLRLRRPTPAESQKLELAWREVLARAAADPDRCEVWVEDSHHVNAQAPAGHVVSVSSLAIDRLSSGQLAAILAHELGHHSGGHAWASRMTSWWSLPAHCFARGLSGMARGVVNVLGRLGCFGALVAVAFLSFVSLLAAGLWFVGLPMLLAPFCTAAVRRRAELRADDYAARLGFAPLLAQVLRLDIGDEESSAGGTNIARMDGWLLVRPDARTRLHHLEPYLKPPAVVPTLQAQSPEERADQLRNLADTRDFPLAVSEVVHALTKVFLALGPPPEGVVGGKVSDEPVPSGGRK